ncbi:MAG: hypothetical protein ACLRM9_04290 [Collinsella aerofaciens]
MPRSIEPVAATPAEDAEVSVAVRMAKLGYHWDDVDEVASHGPAGAPLRLDGHRRAAGLPVKKTRSFFDYFYQLFAQSRTRPSMPCASTW